MHRWIEHTGELEVELAAATHEELFAAGVEAMSELLDDGSAGEALTRTIDLEARDRAALLADWLGELAFLAEREGFVPRRLRALELTGARMRAEVAGVRGEPAHLVKAATYHRLRLEAGADGWRCRVVLDV